MADFDNGLTPQGTDIRANSTLSRITSVLFGKEEARQRNRCMFL